MSRYADNRRDIATATLGYGGVAAGGALRHKGFDEAYGKGGKRPTLLQERKFLRRGKVAGRGKYLAGTAAGVVGLPAAATGTYGVARRVKEDASKADRKYEHSFLGEGLRGVKESLSSRTDVVRDKPPPRLVAQNYALGAGIGAAAGGVAERGLRRVKRLPGAGRAGASAIVGTAAGVGSLPVQNKVVSRSSGGKYVATPTGVRRAKKKPTRPSSAASTARGREQVVPTSKALRFRSQGRGFLFSDEARDAYRGANLRTSAGKERMTTQRELSDASFEDFERKNNRYRRKVSFDKPAATPVLPPARGGVNARLRRRARLTGTEGTAFPGANPGNLLPQPPPRQRPRNQFEKAADDPRLKYPGSHLSRKQKRARVMAASGPPIVGDYAAAAAAARMAPPELRKKTAALQFGGGQLGQAAGAAAGGYGAAALARKVPGVAERSERAQEQIGRAKTEAVRRVSPKTAERMGGPSRTRQAVGRAASKAPGAARAKTGLARAARPMFGHGKGVGAAAALGLTAGQATGAQVGGNMAYGHALNMERRRNDAIRKRSESARHGTRKPPTKAQQAQERSTLTSRKRQQAALSTISGTTGLAALGATLGRKRKFIGPKNRARLERAQTPLLTTGAGVGGYGSLNFAGIQRREAKRVEEMAKAMPRARRRTPVTPRLRRPTAHRGHFRQTRTPTGVSASYVRGGVR